mgnify:CR=1 FL=1
MLWLVKKYRKQSYVHFVLGTAMAASVIGLIVTEAMQIKRDVTSGALFGFQGICSRASAGHED